MSKTEHGVTFVSEKIIVDGIVTDHDGNIIHNAFQQDCPIVYRVDSEGKRHLTRQTDGSYILPPYDPEDFNHRPLCQHCGKAPW